MKLAAALAFLCVLAWSSIASATTLTGPVQIGVSCTSQITINQNTSTDIKTLTNNGYICAIAIGSQSAQSWSLTQGTGTLCATNPVALIGATGTQSSTTGWPLAALGGLTFPMPAGSYIKTTTTGQHLCLLQSGSGAGNVISGVISYDDSP